MTLRAALTTHSLTPDEFAALARVTPSTVYKWCRGVHPVPHMVALLLDAWTLCPKALERARGGINRGE